MLVTLFFAVVLGAQSQVGVSSTPDAPALAQSRAQLAGHWKYNADQSVDAATGRPEAARAASQARNIDGGPAAGQTRRGGGAGGTFGPTSTSIAQDGVYNLYLARRDTRRDLLEIAPELTLEVAANAVKLTDDLDRALTYPTDGSKQNYQLGAAQFSARSSWQDNRLSVEIEGPDGLRMTETWFLSDDGARLFVVIRLGDQDRESRPVGVNRVYDRVR